MLLASFLKAAPMFGIKVQATFGVSGSVAAGNVGQFLYTLQVRMFVRCSCFCLGCSFFSICVLVCWWEAIRPNFSKRELCQDNMLAVQLFVIIFFFFWVTVLFFLCQASQILVVVFLFGIQSSTLCSAIFQAFYSMGLYGEQWQFIGVGDYYLNQISFSDPVCLTLIYHLRFGVCSKGEESVDGILVLTTADPTPHVCAWM